MAEIIKKALPIPLPPYVLKHVIGCEFIELDGQAQRTLQRYIDHTQQRRRLLALLCLLPWARRLP